MALLEYYVAGSNQQIQFNLNNHFGASADFKYDKDSSILSINGPISGMGIIRLGDLSDVTKHFEQFWRNDGQGGAGFSYTFQGGGGDNTTPFEFVNLAIFDLGIFSNDKISGDSIRVGVGAFQSGVDIGTVGVELRNPDTNDISGGIFTLHLGTGIGFGSNLTALGNGGPIPGEIGGAFIVDQTGQTLGTAACFVLIQDNDGTTSAIKIERFYTEFSGTIGLLSNKEQILFDVSNSNFLTLQATGMTKAGQVISLPLTTCTLPGLELDNDFLGTNVFEKALQIKTSSGQLVLGSSPITTLQGTATSSNKLVTLPNFTGTLATIGNFTQVFAGSTTFSVATTFTQSIAVDSAFALYSQFGPNTTVNKGTNGTNELIVNAATSSTSTAAIAISTGAEWQGTSASGNSFSGGNMFAGTSASASGNLTSTANGGGLKGNRAVIQINAAITVSQGSAFTGRVNINNSIAATGTDTSCFHAEGSVITSTGTLTRHAGFWARDGSGAGSIGTQYGLRIDAQTKGTANLAIAIGGTGVGSYIYFNATTAVSTEYVGSSTSNTMDINAATTLNLRVGGNSIMAVQASSFLLKDAVNFVGNTGTGNKLGTATNQKWGFWNATPVIQPAATGVTTSGFTANTSVNTVFAESTFTGNTGSTAYTISDVVKNLKTAGLLAA